MPKITIPSELKDSEVFLPALSCTDQLTILWMSEHIFELVKSLMFHNLPRKKTLEVTKNGKMKWTSAENLFTGMGALSTPSAVIKVAFITDSISEKTYRSLELIKKIRNQCAHSRTEVSLTEDDNSSLIKKLATVTESKISQTEKPILFSHKDPAGKSIMEIYISWEKAAFIESCLHTIASLRHSHFDGKELAPKQQ